MWTHVYQANAKEYFMRDKLMVWKKAKYTSIQKKFFKVLVRRSRDGTFIHFWWKFKVVQPIWKTV